MQPSPRLVALSLIVFDKTTIPSKLSHLDFLIRMLNCESIYIHTRWVLKIECSYRNDFHCLLLYFDNTTMSLKSFRSPLYIYIWLCFHKISVKLWCHYAKFAFFGLKLRSKIFRYIFSWWFQCQLERGQFFHNRWNACAQYVFSSLDLRWLVL